MAFTDAEKTDIRRFCGYPVFGSSANPNNGWRFFTAYGALEFRLNNLSASEENIVRTVYLPNLTQLESDVIGARVNLDTSAAAVWTHNPREVADRRDLFFGTRTDLCGFLGIPPGPGLGDGIRMVV